MMSLAFFPALPRQNGISLPPEEPMVEDEWHKTYKLRKSIEKGQKPLTKAQVEDAWIQKWGVAMGCPHGS